jgi:hypothetical protein
MPVLYTNNATSALSSGITNVATSLTVASGQGSRFPAIGGSDYFYATLTNSSGTVEIVRVTARTTDTLTIVRAQDGTSAAAWNAGDRVELRVTKAMLDDLKADARAANFTSNLTFSGVGLRIRGDFDNATLTNRLSFQTSTTNANTAVTAIANGTGSASYYVAFAGSDPANSAYGWLSATASGVDIVSDKTGTGTVQPIRLVTGSTVRATVTAGGRVQIDAPQDGNITAVGALNIDCSLGNFFTKTISANSTFAVSNVPASRAYAFTLELTHTSGTVTWFLGVQWPGGTAPTLTTGKVHLFTFVTDDGGTTWRGTSQVNYNS